MPSLQAKHYKLVVFNVLWAAFKKEWGAAKESPAKAFWLQWMRKGFMCSKYRNQCALALNCYQSDVSRSGEARTEL